MPKGSVRVRLLPIPLRRARNDAANPPRLPEPPMSGSETSRPTVPGVEGAEAVTAVFGRWPEFHDAEICTVETSSAADRTTVEVALHAFVVTREVDARGNYRLDRHTRVTLRFDDCIDVRMKGLKPTQVIFALRLRPNPAAAAPRPFDVTFESSAGADGHLSCRRIAVTDVRPWQEAPAPQSRRRRQPR